MWVSGAATAPFCADKERIDQVVNELPDLDENVSFIVDNGASLGPVPMREIIARIRSGACPSSSLVWWAGATDWVRFDTLPDLMMLIEQASTPGAHAVGTATETAEPAQPLANRWGVPAESGTTAQPAVASPDNESSESASFEPAAFEPAAFEPAASAVPTAEAAEENVAFGLPKRSSSSADEEVARPALTGLFSSGARSAPTPLGPDAPAPSPDALDAVLAARVSLESVGARIEALSSATKRSASPEELQEFMASAPGSAEPEASDSVVEWSDAQGTEAQPEASESASADAGSWTSVGESTTSVGESAEPATSNNDAARSELNARFEEMVRKSVAHQRQLEWITRVDELLLSACITAIADAGFVAMDLTSRESDHRVLFTHNDDSRRVTLDLTPVDSVGDHAGRHVRFGLSWGRDVNNADVAFQIVRDQATDGPTPPGLLMCEADMSTSSVSTHVDLILAADDFVKDDYSVDRSSLDESIAATLHALENHWHSLFDNA